MSGRKNTLLPIPIVTNGDMSGNITSSSTNIQFLDFWSFEIIVAGTPTGVFDIQISHDNSNWVSIPLSTAPVSTAGSPSPIIIENTQVVPAPYIRLVYTSTSGTGTLNVSLTARQG